MLTDSIPARRILPANAGQLAAELLPDRLAVMRELEASLQGSRKALLALDLAIERGTREQVRLIRELEMVLRRPTASSAIGRQPAEDAAQGLPACAPELEEELRRCESRVRDGARLQAALLARARSKLRVLANMLADPSVTYERLLAGTGAPSHVLVVASEQGLEARRRI